MRWRGQASTSESPATRRIHEPHGSAQKDRDEVGDEQGGEVVLQAVEALVLLHKEELPVAVAIAVKGGFGKIVEVLALSGPLAGEDVGLVVAVQVHLVGLAAYIVALEKFLLKVRLPKRGHNSRNPVLHRHELPGGAARRDLPGLLDHHRHLECLFIPSDAFLVPERLVSVIRPAV